MNFNELLEGEARAGAAQLIDMGFGQDDVIMAILQAEEDGSEQLLDNALTLLTERRGPADVSGPPDVRSGLADELLVPEFANMDKIALDFFREHGFLVFDKDTIPPEQLEAARPAVEAGAPYGCSCDGVIFDLFYKTKLYGFITQLLGEDPAPDFRGWVQVASVEAQQDDIPSEPLVCAVGPHIDLGHGNKSCCHKPEGTHLDRFSMLLGIPFTATTQDFMGNFGVFRGSHLKIAKLFEEKGYDGIFHRDEHLRDPKHPSYYNARYSHAWSQTNSIGDSCDAVVFKVELGQAYITHYNTIHWAQKNLRLTEPRNVVYFRIQHPRAHHEYDKSAFANLWKDYPCFGGLWSNQAEDSSKEEEDRDPPAIVEESWTDWSNPARFKGIHDHWCDPVFFNRDNCRFQKSNHDPGSWMVTGGTLSLQWDVWGQECLTTNDGGLTFVAAGFKLEGDSLPSWWIEQFKPTA